MVGLLPGLGLRNSDVDPNIRRVPYSFQHTESFAVADSMQDHMRPLAVAEHQNGTVGGAEFAVGAASWRARAWLGADILTPGASADLIVLDADPRADLSTLYRPVARVLRGRVL